MPRRPSTFCVICLNAVPSGDYCAQHKPKHDAARKLPAYRDAQLRAREFIGRRCPKCGRTMTLTNPPTVEHDTPLRHGADPHDESNWSILCRHCNTSRR